MTTTTTAETEATIYVCDAEGGATIREADADDLRAARDADAHTGTYEDPRTGETVTLDAEMDDSGRYILPREDAMLVDLVAAVDAYTKARRPIAEWPAAGLPLLTPEQRKAIAAADTGVQTAVRRLIDAWAGGWRPEAPHRLMVGSLYVRAADGRVLMAPVTEDAYRHAVRRDQGLARFCREGAADHLVVTE